MISTIGKKLAIYRVSPTRSQNLVNLDLETAENDYRVFAHPYILLFLPVKSNFCRKKSATKILCVKTSSGNVVLTLFPHLRVHRWITGDVPIYL